MKPDNVNTILLATSNSVNSSSLLFQCANFYCGQGQKTLYISPTPFDKLPPGIHGMPEPSSNTLSNIQFLYLPQYQDLLKQIFSLHLFAQIPSLIIIEKLDYYCHITCPETPEKYDSEVHSAKICASLLDATSVCAKCNKSVATLIASFEYSPVQESIISLLIDNFFNSVVWTLDKTQDTESEERNKILMQTHSHRTSGKGSKIEFLSATDESLILLKVINCTQI